MNITLAFLMAVISVESGSRDHAVNESEGAWGCMQIRQIFIDDVNRIIGKPGMYVHEDAFNREKSMEMALIYLNHYATVRRLGHEPTFEDMARIFNGGPMGFNKPCTLKYWEKVERALNNQPEYK